MSVTRSAPPLTFREVLKIHWPEKLDVLDAAENLVRQNAESIEAICKSKPANHEQHLNFSHIAAVDRVIAAAERSLEADRRDDLYQRSQRIGNPRLR